MHKAVFSENERLIIKEYLETGTEAKGFRVLKHRVNQYKLTIIEDYNLMTQFIEKTQTPTRMNDERAQAREYLEDQGDDPKSRSIFTPSYKPEENIDGKMKKFIISD